MTDDAHLRATKVLLAGLFATLAVWLGLIQSRCCSAWDVAVHAAKAGSSDPILLGLARLDRRDIAAVRELLRAVDPDEADLYPPQSVRKWTYLELQAAYNLRDKLTDPLGFVEHVYADFEYPASVAKFVRYMPPPPDAAVGAGALFDRWRKFLQDEAAALSAENS